MISCGCGHHRSLTLLALAALLGGLCGATSLAAENAPPNRPNILVVLCDDLGYGDVACYGHPVIQTPNVDRLAAEGLRLTSCYAAAPNCSPARTGLMTGRTPYRVGVYNWIPFLSPIHVPSTERTVATLLREAGYQTCQVGKWHLNGWFNLPGQPQPGDHGFDHWFATQNNALPNHLNPYNFVKNGIPSGPLEGDAAHLVAGEARRWLLEDWDRSRPFFMYVCFHEPHEPIATSERFSKLYDTGDEPARAAHHGNITQMDHALGELLSTLSTEGLDESTFVLFTSDNGPAQTSWHPYGSTGPLRSKKGHLYEGGIRVPGIVRWPGRVSAGSVSDVPVSGVDVLPTACDLAGVALPSDRTLDGTSIAPLWKGGEVERTQPLYWQFNYARSHPRVAIRSGEWKLLAGLDPADQGNLTDIVDEQMRQLKSAKLQGFELYHLGRDIGETHDLSEEEPERLAEMVALMRKVYVDVRDEGPEWGAWEWPRYESKRIEWPAYERPLRPAATK